MVTPVGRGVFLRVSHTNSNGGVAPALPTYRNSERPNSGWQRIWGIGFRVDPPATNSAEVCAEQGLIHSSWVVNAYCRSWRYEQELTSVLWKVEMKDVPIFRTTAPQYSSSLNLSRVNSTSLSLSLSLSLSICVCVCVCVCVSNVLETRVDCKRNVVGLQCWRLKLIIRTWCSYRGTTAFRPFCSMYGPKPAYYLAFKLFWYIQLRMGQTPTSLSISWRPAAYNVGLSVAKRMN